MATKHDLRGWILDALKANSGTASLVDVCRHVWQVHETDLRMSGDLFFTWQYDIRWAAQGLRDEGVLVPDDEAPRGIWKLSAQPSS